MIISYKIPDELYYSKTHEWAQADDNLITVGLTEFKLDQLGEILFLDLPDEGKNVTQGEVCFSIESTKFIHDFISPVNGTVIEVNNALIEDPSIINDDPFNDGWIIKIEIDSEKDLLALMRSNAYRQMIGMKPLPTHVEEKEVIVDEPLADDGEDDEDDED